MCLIAPTYAAEANRNAVQAAYLYRFLEFVQFPNTHDGAGLCLCIVGNPALRDLLATAVSGKTIAGRPINVQAMENLRAVGGCQELFVTGRKNAIAAELAGTESQPILIVSDLPEAQKNGAVILLTVRDDRMEFDIDVENARRRGLSISSRLLALSRSSR